MTAQTPLAPAVLDFVTHGTYPDSEATASATLDGPALTSLLTSLHQAQEEIKNDIRSLSRDTAPDIDTWISRAKILQADIVRSRDTAHQIVADAEATRVLRAGVIDAEKKVDLLEREVVFNETLTGTLEHISYANSLLDQVEVDFANGDPGKAQKNLGEAQASIEGLENIHSSHAYRVLSKRFAQFRESAVETVRECWDALVIIDPEQRRLSIESETPSADVHGGILSTLNLDSIVKAAEGLSMLEALAQRLARDVEKAIIRPLMLEGKDGTFAKLAVDGHVLSASGKSADPSTGGLLKDLSLLLDFLATRLPASVTVPLSRTLIPAMTSRLEDTHLSTSIPLSVSKTPAFQDTLTATSALADQIDKLDWQGADALRVWVQSAPRLWLTKRREALLGEVRNIAFTGLRETETVERTETRVVGMNGDPSVNYERDGGATERDEDWGTAWDDAEAEVKAEDTPQPAGDAGGDDDDASAWELDEEEVDEEDTESKRGASSNGGAEEDAWGWEDENPSTRAPDSVVTPQDSLGHQVNGDKQQSTEQEVTIRENFMVTATPKRLFTIIQGIILDAQTLATDPSLAGSPVASAASALYTLPTLALAIYRAVAPTTYSKLPTGNMLIYNDGSYLAQLLRDWQASQTPGSRLRLDNDVKAIDTFAKRAYASEMESQRTILKDILDGAQGFANCTTPPFKAECESAVVQTVDRLRDVHTQWKKTLSNGALLQSLGSLLATATEKMISEIEDLGDISEVDSKQLKTLCERMMTIKDLFSTPGPDGNGESQDMTFVYCPGWLKFQYLSEIMDSSLADIKWMWNEGELSLEFDVEEIVELVEALFAESDLRRRAVAEVRRGGRR